MAEKDQAEPQTSASPMAIFRIPRMALIAVALLVVCITPVALGEIRGFEFLYLFPIGLAAFVIRLRTVATKDGLSVRTLFGHRELLWADLKGLAITDRARVRAVLTDDSEVALPTVRTRHLPVLSVVSAGRLADPTGLTTEQDAASQE